MSNNVHVRWMIRRDMPAVFDIEYSSFEFPWTEEEFIKCLRQRNNIGMVAECNESIVGFMIYELHAQRLHVLNLAVDPKRRREGVGSAMIEKLTSKLDHQRRNRIILEVRETNLEAQLFLKSAGFRAVRVLDDYYGEGNEAAYQFRYNVPVQSNVFS